MRRKKAGGDGMAMRRMDDFRCGACGKVERDVLHDGTQAVICECEASMTRVWQAHFHVPFREEILGPRKEADLYANCALSSDKAYEHANRACSIKGYSNTERKPKFGGADFKQGA